MAVRRALVVALVCANVSVSVPPRPSAPRANVRRPNAPQARRPNAPQARPAAHARSPQRNAHRVHAAKKPVGPKQQEINQARIRSEELEGATLASANLTDFCADPPSRTFKANSKTISPGPRSIEVDCFARWVVAPCSSVRPSRARPFPRFHEAHLTEMPGDPVVGKQMQGACCTDRKRHAGINPPYIIFPRSHIEAAMFYANTSTRDVDINFMGRLTTKQETANRARKWIFDFVKSTFTDRSIFIDTTVEHPATYKKLGPYDISVGADGKPAGFKPMGVMGEQKQNPCVMAKCSTDYFQRLARSRYTLSPAGDKPWSQRFFEAIMAGSIPILASQEHAGRNHKEKTLGYKYLLLSEYVARRRKFQGDPPYCPEWAQHNLDIFLRHHSYIMRRQTIHPNLDRCIAEAF